ncbi:MAG: tetratricopeptide repeat protein [Acidobacteria bacterium]|nr:tetratricopeptide repeat protein [Acidobacteriota bacterium]
MTMNGPTRAAAVTAAALAAVCAGCAHGGGAAPTVSHDRAPIRVDAATLWDPNTAKDPIVAYRLRLETEPNNPALHNNLGNLYVQRNWMDEAIDEYRKAIDIDGESATAWNNLGTAYHKLGKLSASKSAFERATRIDPRYALAWYGIGTIFDEQGDYDRAVDMYLKAVSLKPDLLDPAVNPQVINNTKILAIRLRKYLEQGGSLALPLEPMPE